MPYMFSQRTSSNPFLASASVGRSSFQPPAQGDGVDAEVEALIERQRPRIRCVDTDGDPDGALSVCPAQQRLGERLADPVASPIWVNIYALQLSGLYRAQCPGAVVEPTRYPSTLSPCKATRTT